MWISKKMIRGPSSFARYRGNLFHGRSVPRLPFTIGHLLVFFSAFYFLNSNFSHAASGRYDIQEVRPHVFLWVPEDVVYTVGDPQFPRSGTAAFVITAEGVVVINTTNNPFNARELLYEIRQRTELPVKYVIDTDARGDHILGNEVFVDQQAAIISTSVAQAEMRAYYQDLVRRTKDDTRMEWRLRGFHPTVSTQTFDGQMTLQVGGVEFRLLDWGKGPLAGAVVVYLPGSKVLFLGELYEHAEIPHRGLTDIKAWQAALRQVDSMDVLVYIPSGGPPGDPGDFQDFRDFLQWVSGDWLATPPPAPTPASSQPARWAMVEEGGAE